MDVLVPTYFKDFRCIGASCEDTCCKGWDVFVDKNAYKIDIKNKMIYSL
ncbi:hypothetical protein WG909_03245 [Peptostreptococcaceae bacterium AGR-M142]